MWLAVITALLIAAGFPALAAAAPPASPAVPADLPPVAAGQPDVNAAAPDAAPLLDWSHARRVFPYIEQCIRAGGVEDAPTPQPVWVADLRGARVTIRWLGRTMGQGEARLPLLPSGPTPASTEAGPVIDLVQTVRAATAAALVDLNQTLAARNDRASLRADDAAAFTPWRIADLRPLNVDLQLAHRVEPIRLADDAPPDALFRAFAPGYHGLLSPAIEGGVDANGLASTASTSWVWPATALAMNQSPASQVRQLLDAVGTPALKLHEAVGRVARTGGMPISRFEVIHLVRVDESQPPVNLVRGNVLLPPTSVTSQTLADMAQRMTAFLVHRQTNAGQMRGTYHPTSDQFDPAQAPIEDMALTAYVLARRAAMIAPPPADPNAPTLSIPDPAATNAEDADGQPLSPATVRDAATRMLRPLVRRYMSADAPREPGAMALTLLALLETDDGGNRQIERDALGDHLLEVAAASGLLNPRDAASSDTAAADAGEGRTVGPEQVLVTLALVRLATTPEAPTKVGDAARQALAVIEAGVDHHQIITALPWYAMALRAGAELQNTAGTGRRDPQTPTSPARTAEPATTRLAELVELLSRLQIEPGARLGPDDSVGGFDLLPGSGLASPVADWRSANVLGLLALDLRHVAARGISAAGATEGSPDGGAGMAGDESKLVQKVVDCGRAARFLQQLMFDTRNAYYVRSLPDVLGGVRPALWDNRLSTAPTAMALLAVTELQQALEALNGH